jgi:hypothetical protein
MPDPSMPAVGETWYSDTYSNTWGELTVVGVIGDMVNCRSGGGVTVQPGKTGMFFRSALSRRIRPATEATDGPVWKVGDRVEGREYWRGNLIRGAVHRPKATECAYTGKVGILVQPDAAARCYVLDPSTLRRLDSPPSVPVNGPVICADCGKEIEKAIATARWREFLVCFTASAPSPSRRLRRRQIPTSSMASSRTSQATTESPR